ncbi:serine hydrolase domain-containing protein [Solilutibacter silvestris]|uniref:Beta-lactamase class C and other penicillin binding protein n=1 Tax=Solilutibacter silvestris TaxID=1645665 RepID=A0A2K1Q0H2_9GAMM|nr:serine hydrolase domain-containing protein [Lysobacter silvestris]PNS08535.1 Beta-lactamase class C and other penicillin binding protein [Lysobacter silvestris]
MRNKSRRWTVASMLVALLVAAPVHARDANTHAVDGVSRHAFSKQRAIRIDAALQRYVDDGRLAGAVALVLQDGKPVYQRAVGWSDKEAGRPMRVDTVFRIASQTKAITSTAILMLAEEGKLTLNDAVSRTIPAFAHTTVIAAGDAAPVPAKRAITLRDLLTHTAGISYGTDKPLAEIYKSKGFGTAAGHGWYLADKDEGICTTVERLATLPFDAQPGEKWIYGYNTDILGCVVERVSGMPLDAFIRSRITAPLGMKDTQFYLDPAQRTRLATVYASKDGRAVRAPDGSMGQGAYIDGPRRSFSGGAGLLSTAHDYARFLEMIRRGGTLGGVRILSPRSVRLMTTNQVSTIYSNDGMGYGYGFETTDRYGANGMDGVGAFGWGGAYGTSYRVDPESHLVLVLMIQQLPNATDIHPVFSTLVYQALE